MMSFMRVRDISATKSETKLGGDRAASWTWVLGVS